MASYNYGIGTSGGFGGSPSTPRGTSNEIQYGRVLDVIIDSDHPRFQEFNFSQAINGIIYRPLGGPVIEDKELTQYFAYQDSNTFQKLPLIGEIVEIYSAPSEEITENFSGTKKTYYRSIVELWNNPHLNLLPDIYQDERNQTNPDPGFGFVENENLVPLQSFPGDVVVQGRLGQSIRFSGTSHKSNIYSDNSNNNSPFTIIRNGQGVNGVKGGTIVEDVNRDPTSIYMMSNHTVPLEQANYKRLSYDDTPTEAYNYKGNQLILNSGRIFLNAKEESVLISGNQSVGLNAKTVNLDGEDYLALDADYVYLGEKARRASTKEPVVLGIQLQLWLNELLDILDSMQRDFATALTPPQASAALLKQAGSLPAKIVSLRTSIENHHSTKVYSE